MPLVQISHTAFVLFFRSFLSRQSTRAASHLCSTTSTRAKDSNSFSSNNISFLCSFSRTVNLPLRVVGKSHSHFPFIIIIAFLTPQHM